jgi:hypothetical protein
VTSTRPPRAPEAGTGSGGPPPTVASKRPRRAAASQGVSPVAATNLSETTTKVTPADCSVCRRALPQGEAVAFAEKQQLIHIACYDPSTNGNAGKAITVRRADPRRQSNDAGTEPHSGSALR